MIKINFSKFPFHFFSKLEVEMMIFFRETVSPYDFNEVQMIIQIVYLKSSVKLC